MSLEHDREWWARNARARFIPTGEGATDGWQGTVDVRCDQLHRGGAFVAAVTVKPGESEVVELSLMERDEIAAEQFKRRREAGDPGLPDRVDPVFPRRLPLSAANEVERVYCRQHGWLKLDVREVRRKHDKALRTGTAQVIRLTIRA